MKPRCTGCGRTDVDMLLFECTWPDKRVTTERHCQRCQITWQRQLRSLGVKIVPLPPE